MGAVIYVVKDHIGDRDVFNWKGSRLTCNTLDFFSLDGIASDDVTGDGVAETLIADDGNVDALTVPGVGDVHIFNSNGTKLRTLPKSRVNFTEGDGFAVGDVTGDGIAEIVLAGDVSHVVDIFDQFGNKVRPSFRSAFGDDPRAVVTDAFAVGDVNGDLRAEILVARPNGRVPGTGRVFIYGDDGTWDDQIDPQLSHRLARW